VKSDGAGFARLKVNALKAAQSQQRRAVNPRKLQVEFGDFIARQFACVGDGNLGGQRITGLDGICAQLQIAVLERRVTQAEAEREQGLASEVAVGSSLHGVVAEGRQLVETGIEGYGQAPRWVVAAG
jgi:hypothetical protein